MANAWIKHLTAFRNSHKGMSLRDAMKGAKKTYKRTKTAVGKAVKAVTKKRRRRRRKGKKGTKKVKRKRRRRRR
jgi:hypothetical protein